MFVHHLLVDENSETFLVGFQGVTVATNNAQTLATYDVTLIFGNNSIDTPSTAEADLLVFAAFNRPFVPELVASLNGLPAANPFSTTANVVYNPVRRQRWLTEIQELPGTTRVLGE